jgi:hypothetical protein
VRRAIGPKASSRADLADYSQFESNYKNVISVPGCRLKAGEAAVQAASARMGAIGCTNFGQGAVDGVHFIENREVVGGDF